MKGLHAYIHRLRLRRIAQVGLLWGLGLLLTTCSLEDDRDICCRQVVIKYSYQPYGQDVLEDYITTLRHYLFDAEGRFIAEIPSGSNLRYQPLSLDKGRYTLISLGNASEHTVCTSVNGQGIQDFLLQVNQPFEGRNDLLDNGDELYWGVQTFTVDPAQPTRALGDYLVETALNNIHCHLTLDIVWHNLPPHVGDYTLELKNVASSYWLNPDQVDTLDGFIVPALADAQAGHRLRVPLQAQTLHGEFITLRYADDQLPVLKIWFGDEAITGDIDLSQAFRQWGWSPSKTHVQKYALQLEVFGNGNVAVAPQMDASVEDWIQGGTFQ